MSTWYDVIHRADSDAQFRNRLIDNPAAACEESGVSFPAGTTVKVIEQQPEEVCLVLRPFGSGELDDAELAGVAGGTDPLRLLAQVSALQAQEASDELGKESSTSTTTPTPPKQPTTPKRPRGIT